MNKKGLTLIELMAVIAILAILAIMITPGIITVRNNVLESSYKNKVSQIVTAAIDYGQEHINELNNVVDESNPDNSCIYRNVNFLINNGYLKVGNSYSEEGVVTQLTDPRDGSSINNLRVCIRFDSNSALRREIIAYLAEE